jgi:hypothetical protein
MSKQQLIEREQRWGPTAGLLGIIGVILILLPAFAGLGGDFNTLPADEYAERLEAFEANRGEILAAQIIQAIGLLLFAPPLLFLFQAAMHRSSAVRRQLMPLTVIGPVLYAVALMLFYVAYDAAAPAFAEGAPAAGDRDQFAEDTLTEESAYGLYLGLQLAAALSLVVAVIYTSLQAMRAGLLTRFVGTLGMALGVGFLLFGPLGPLALGIYLLTISLLIAGWWRGPRPPAWETGEAIPWPKPGQAPPAPEEEPARPEDFDGSGRELEDEDASKDAADELEAALGGDDDPARPDNRRKRKRKQRG